MSDNTQPVPVKARAISGGRAQGEEHHSRTDAVLDVRDLRVEFEQGGTRVLAVEGLSYRVFAGQTLAMIGESGSGKSVSCRAVMGLLPDTAKVSGSIRFEGKELAGLTPKELRRYRGAGVAMVFQDADRALNPTMRIGYQITEAVLAHERVHRRAARDRAVELLRTLGLPEPERRFSAYPHELSGGMRQRVMIAIALAARPKVLIADESARSLDLITQAKTMKLLVNLQRTSGMALVLISHDLGLAAQFADEVIVLYAGRQVEQAPTEQLFRRPRTPYTKALLDAIPRLGDRRHTPFPVVPGQQPSAKGLLAGCRFAPRCSQSSVRCVECAPPFQLHEGDHRWACWHPRRYGEEH